jgi:hypothetical protein
MSSGKGSGKFIVNLADQTKFGPKLTVQVSKALDEEGKFIKGKYLLQIVHPNKTVPVLNAKGEEIVDKRSGRRKLVGAVILEQVVENSNPDEIKAFLEVKAIGDKMLGPKYWDDEANNGRGGYVGGEYYNFKTDYEEILFIPAARKGKSKLKTKKSISQGIDGEVDNQYDEQDDMQEVIYTEEELNQEDVEVVTLPPEEVEAPKVIVVGKKGKKPAKVKKEKVVKVKAKATKVKNNNKNKKKVKVSPKKKSKPQKNKNKKKR